MFVPQCSPVKQMSLAAKVRAFLWHWLVFVAVAVPHVLVALLVLECILAPIYSLSDAM